MHKAPECREGEQPTGQTGGVFNAAGPVFMSHEKVSKLISGPDPPLKLSHVSEAFEHRFSAGIKARQSGRGSSPWSMHQHSHAKISLVRRQLHKLLR